MKVLLIGKNGLLGAAIKRTFEKRFDVIAYESSDLDITDKQAVFASLEEIQPDLVINCAAYSNVERAEEDFEKAKNLNADAVEYLAKACNKAGADLLHFSTDYVFNGSQDGYDEDATREPLNAYGRSKKIGEDALFEYHDRYFLVRISWLFGPDGNNFVDTMLRFGKDKDKMNVVSDQRGKPTYAPDVAEAVLDLVEKGDYGIYHLPNEGSTNWAEYAREIFELAGLDTKVNDISSQQFAKDFNSKVKRPACSILVNNKWRKLRPYKEALKSFIESKR